MNDTNCRLVRDRLAEAAGDRLDERTSSHVASCAECARLVGRERRLVALLSALPAAPLADFAPPALPPRPAGRLVPLRVRLAVASAAAAALVVVTCHFAARETPRVTVERVVVVSDAPPQIDERLLALTAGFEVVAMRRPTEIR